MEDVRWDIGLSVVLTIASERTLPERH
jgi:hypothetical protein